MHAEANIAEQSARDVLHRGELMCCLIPCFALVSCAPTDFMFTDDVDATEAAVSSDVDKTNDAIVSDASKDVGVPDSQLGDAVADVTDAAKDVVDDVKQSCSTTDIGSCGHSPCVTGIALTDGCDPDGTVHLVCSVLDSSCCSSAWNSTCVSYADMVDGACGGCT